MRNRLANWSGPLQMDDWVKDVKDVKDMKDMNEWGLGKVCM